uniref:Uncharacterized protein n=1 Tax=Magallana gigas TaxID=29159 RepID=A0A8W8KJN9_MAGGI
MDVIIAIQFGIRHTSNACMIKHDHPKEFEEFNVVFDTKSNTQLQTKSHTTPTVALFDDNGDILSYGFEAELQNKQFNNTSSHLLFREFIWDLFCSNETVPENLTAVNGRQMKSIDVVTAVLCHMAGFSSGNINIAEEAAAVLQFCLHEKQHTGVTTLDDDTCHRKYIVVECEGMQGSLVKPDSKNELEFKRDKCVIKSDRFQILFANAGTFIVDYIEEKILTVFPDIDYIILGGEFAQSPILHDIIKTSFSAKNIIIPCEANMAAVRGAVFFGQRSIAVETNVSLFH